MIFYLHTVIREVTLNGKHALLFTPGHCTRQLKTILKIMNGYENSGNFLCSRTRGHEATLHCYLQIV